ncbi:hypothetical protein [Aeromonas aquatica]|uniref:hypothetical protein n=1 Tax=Aeromonas aquatica TaxID=558964 RepID=UPI000AA853D2|nr:hypothetical protein [Aeromonas aquatica]
MKAPKNLQIAVAAQTGATSRPEPSTLGNVESGALVPLNFRVSSEFRRELKTYAATKDKAMVDILAAAIRQYIQDNP